MGLLCVMLTLNQVVIGIAIALAMQGVTSLAHHVLYARDFPRLPRQPEFAIPVLSDLPYVGASLEVMERDARKMRNGAPFVFTNLMNLEGLDSVIGWIKKYALTTTADEPKLCR